LAKSADSNLCVLGW